MALSDEQVHKIYRRHIWKWQENLGAVEKTSERAGKRGTKGKTSQRKAGTIEGFP